MHVYYTYVNPPIPPRNCDWSCSFTNDEDAPRGWGATKEDALNNLLDNTDVEDIAKHFGIEVREVDTLRGPEYGHWLATSESGESLEAAWKDQAIVDLAFKIAQKELLKTLHDRETLI